MCAWAVCRGGAEISTADPTFGFQHVFNGRALDTYLGLLPSAMGIERSTGGTSSALSSFPRRLRVKLRGRSWRTRLKAKRRKSEENWSITGVMAFDAWRHPFKPKKKEGVQPDGRQALPSS